MMQLSNIPDDVGPIEIRRWQDMVNLLKSMQVDYQGTREKLEQINLHIAEREALVGQQIRHALLSSQGYHSLRLTKYSIENSLCRMGNAILGGTSYPGKKPEASSIEVCCLGRFEARSPYKQIEDWHSSKAKQVFQYLLIKPYESTTKEILIEAFWPGCAVPAANNNLKAAIHSLRLSLSEILRNMDASQIVLFSDGSYRINPEISLLVDVTEFEKLRDNARRLEKEQRMAEAIKEFEKAESLYRGDYLEDEPYEEWTLIKRETLMGNYLFILGKLADYYFKAGDYESCIYYSQKIIAKDTSREDAYRNLIHCYLKLNQRTRASRWYEICCRAIKSELDTLPERETIELGEGILNYNVDQGVKSHGSQ